MLLKSPTSPGPEPQWVLAVWAGFESSSSQEGGRARWESWLRRSVCQAQPDARGGGCDPAQEGGSALHGPHLCEDSQNHSRATKQETGV